ncbi:MAG: hypothetical protein KA260_03315 [Burkholderiales bacterium]|nr:hypothetical protein [Burkholderiales bacterium]
MPTLLRTICATLSLSALALAEFPSPAWAGASNLKSGAYGAELKLAVAPLDKGRVTGYFVTLDKTCRLYFHGLPKGEIFQIAVANAADANFASYGELLLTYDGDTPIVQLNVATLPGCKNAAPDLAKLKYRLQYKADWQSIRLINAKRAYFHSDARDSTKQRAYVVRWDAVAVLRETPAFARAQYLDDKVATTGWLRQEDVAPPDFSPELAYVRTQLPPMQGKWPQGALPVEVRAFLNARERCEHFEGEEITDAARQKFLAAAVKRECGDAKQRFAALNAVYAKRPAEAKFLKDNAPNP